MADILGDATSLTVNRGPWSSTHCVARNSDPLKTVSFVTAGHDVAIANNWNILRIPSSCNPPGEADGHVVVINADDNRYLWEFNGARKDASGNWSAARVHRWDRQGGINSIYGGGGRGVNARYTANTEGTNACSASAAIAQGTILRDELNAGVINHALRWIYHGEYGPSHTSYYPCIAYRNGNESVDRSNAGRLGERFMLDPNINVDSLNIGKDMKTILKAGQQYGWIFAESTSVGYSYWAAETNVDWTGYDFSTSAVAGGFDNFVYNNSRWVKCIDGSPGECSGASTTSTPTVTITANPTSITSESSSTLTWSSTNANSCTASGGWIGTKATSGSQSVSPTANTTYTLSCTGAGGTVSQSATVTVTVSQSFNFNLTNGGAKSVTRGSSVTNSITATLSSGTTQPANFTVSGLPTEATGTFSPVSCSPTCTTTLTINTLSTTPIGNSTITLIATAGSVIKTSTFTLTVNASPLTLTAITTDVQDVDQTLAGTQFYNGMTVKYSASATGHSSWEWLYSINGNTPISFLKGTGAIQDVTFTHSSAGISYKWFIKATNGSAIKENTLNVNIISRPVITPVMISNVNVVTTAHTATITWITDKPASSKVEYGTSNLLGYSTSETDIAAKTTTHFVTHDNLISCTTYYFKVLSKDANGNTASNQLMSYPTQGCTGASTILENTERLISRNQGGSLTLINASQRGLSISIPVNYSAQNATFQINKLSSSAVFQAAPLPQGTRLLSDYIYELNALPTASTSISTFDNPLTLTVSYDSASIGNINASTLKLYRWNPLINSWQALSSCVVNTPNNTVTCNTATLSTYGLFGDEIFVTQQTQTTTSSDSGRSGGGGGSSSTSSQQSNSGLYTPSSFQTVTAVLTGPFGPGISGTQVSLLQQLLTRNGVYPEATISGFYGSATQAAVKRFQQKYGIEATGIAGPKTRTKLNELYGGTTISVSITEAQRQEQIRQIKILLVQLIQQLITLMQAEQGQR